MKKFALMLAALGLCAGSLVACGGDDVEEPADGDCMVHEDCKDPAKPHCSDDYKCIATPEDGGSEGEDGGSEGEDGADGDCMVNEDCKDPAKPHCGADYKCVEAPADNCSSCKEGEEVCVGGTTCAPTAAEGDSCDAAFVTRCSGVRDILICDGDEAKTVTKKGCAAGYTCQETLAGYAECVEECPAELKEGDIQYADCDAAVAYRYICRPAFDVTGTLFAFETIEDCSATAGNTCSANAEKTEALCVAATPAE